MKDKNPNRQIGKMLTAGVILALLSACSSPRFIKSARNPAEQNAAPLHQVTVAGMDERSEVRIPFENDVVRNLRERGVQATATYPSYSFDEMNVARSQVLQRLKAAGAESVLFVRITDRNDIVDWSPVKLGVSDAEEVDELQYKAFTDPGGNVKTDLRLGARLYRVSDGALVWGGLLDGVIKESTDPIAFIKSAAKTIVNRMAKDKAIP